jgi:hypothetical protein
MRVNLGAVKEGTFEPLPQGQYHVRVVKAEEVTGETKQDGTLKAPYITTWFEIVAGDYTGRLIFKNFIFTQNALPFLKPFLVALGYPTDQDVDINPNDWLNEQLVVQVEREIYQGKEKDVPAGYYSLVSQKIQQVPCRPY